MEVYLSWYTLLGTFLFISLAILAVSVLAYKAGFNDCLMYLRLYGERGIRRKFPNGLH